MASDRRLADAQAIAKALGSPKATGGGWSCKCPAHDDKHSSLSLTVKDGKLLWRCHAGCDQAKVQDALARLGHIDQPRVALARPARPIASGRSMAVIAGGKPAPSTQATAGIGRIAAIYDYVDATGELLFQVVRFDPKTFRQRRPRGAGWEWGLGQTKPVIYRLPEVLGAETVYVCEGEKGTEAARKIGLVATNSPMGAGKWRPEMGEALAGKHVVILPDNDEPGRRHAADVAASAREHDAASIRILELPRLPEKGDLFDWLTDGNDRADLEVLVRGCPLWGLIDDNGADPGWRQRLIQGDQGPAGNEANAALALCHAPELVGRLRHDAFRSEVQGRDLPWDRRPEWRDLTDHDMTELAIWLQHADINIRVDRAGGAVEAVARRAGGHHPVRAYLEGLTWDGTPRVGSWLAAYLGADGSDSDRGRYIAAVGRCWLISAIARVFQPGCKADAALILEGEQGAMKSTSMRVLCGADWFADEIAQLGGKDAAQDIRGKWVIELAELSAMSRGEVETMKAFMSRAVDHYRPSYGRKSIDVPRQCVFVGSTNRDDYLKDDTGNRRFWPVKVGTIKIKSLMADRNQLWAEAAHLFRKGERWWLTKEEEALAQVEQGDRVESHPWDDVIARWVDDPIQRMTGFFTTGEILGGALGMPKERWDERSTKVVARALRSLGWKRGKSPGGRSVKRENGYCRAGVSHE